MSQDLLQQVPHRRFNPLLREWVLISPHRTQRPWQGSVEKPAVVPEVDYDPNCYLCPGNERAGGVRNPKYASTFVFQNDFAALLPDAPWAERNDGDLLIARSESGICRVVCFSPRHGLTVPLMEPAELRKVVDVWCEQFLELERMPWIRHVQVFENRGAMMGASNPHPHCQIWANGNVPNIPGAEIAAQRAYRIEKTSCLLCDYLRLELARDERIVCQNEAFAVLIPYWAVWPFETLLLSKRHLAAMHELDSSERDLLADILKKITVRYDNVFQTAFPYSMGFHQRPCNGASHPEFHFHGHYYPPLLRSATVRKFMVGYELLANPQRDITPESAAERLAAQSEIHYSKQ